MTKAGHLTGLSQSEIEFSAAWRKYWCLRKQAPKTRDPPMYHHRRIPNLVTTMRTSALRDTPNRSLTNANRKFKPGVVAPLTTERTIMTPKDFAPLVELPRDAIARGAPPGAVKYRDAYNAAVDGLLVGAVKIDGRWFYRKSMTLEALDCLAVKLPADAAAAA